MTSITRYVFCVLALAVAAGCASTKVVGREEYREKIPRPAHIWSTTSPPRPPKCRQSPPSPGVFRTPHAPNP